jgi:hypothetical protein
MPPLPHATSNGWLLLVSFLACGKEKGVGGSRWHGGGVRGEVAWGGEPGTQSDETTHELSI